MKRSIFTVLNIAGLLVGAVLWLLSMLVPESFGWFNLAYAVLIVGAVLGTTTLLNGVSDKTNVITKKAKIAISAVFYVIAVVALVFAIALPTNIIPPVICIVILVIALCSTFAVGGKKWDQGDNQQSGYKNYYQRKAEEEEKKNPEEE